MVSLTHSVLCHIWLIRFGNGRDAREEEAEGHVPREPATGAPGGGALAARTRRSGRALRRCLHGHGGPPRARRRQSDAEHAPEARRSAGCAPGRARRSGADGSRRDDDPSEVTVNGTLVLLRRRESIPHFQDGLPQPLGRERLVVPVDQDRGDDQRAERFDFVDGRLRREPHEDAGEGEEKTEDESSEHGRSPVAEDSDLTTLPSLASGLRSRSTGGRGGGAMVRDLPAMFRTVVNEADVTEEVAPEQAVRSGFGGCRDSDDVGAERDVEEVSAVGGRRELEGHREDRTPALTRIHASEHQPAGGDQAEPRGDVDMEHGAVRARVDHHVDRLRGHVEAAGAHRRSQGSARRHDHTDERTRSEEGSGRGSAALVPGDAHTAAWPKIEWYPEGETVRVGSTLATTNTPPRPKASYATVSAASSESCSECTRPSANTTHRPGILRISSGKDFSNCSNSARDASNDACVFSSMVHLHRGPGSRHIWQLGPKSTHCAASVIVSQGVCASSSIPLGPSVALDVHRSVTKPPRFSRRGSWTRSNGAGRRFRKTDRSGAGCVAGPTGSRRSTGCATSRGACGGCGSSSRDGCAWAGSPKARRALSDRCP